jgi:hypothetical protein
LITPDFSQSCSALLVSQCVIVGRPLDVPLRFHLSPFGADLEVAWQRSMLVIRDCETSESASRGAKRDADAGS